MFKILNKQILAKDVKRLDVKAPLIATRIAPGQFVMIITHEGGDWIPMAVAEAEPMRGLITFTFQESNAAGVRLGGMTIGEDIFSIIGPLGQPVPVEKFGVVVCVATGANTAQILSVCKALKKAGNKVIGIIGARSKASLTLEPQMRIACSKLLITTEDGSYERRGLASEIFKEVLEGEIVKRAYAVGSIEMMAAICKMTKPKAVKTFVQLSPAMACGTGFCGSCRVKVDDKITLACTSGPMFNGHEVDFEHLKIRLNGYQNQIQTSESTPDEMTHAISKFFPGLLGR